MKECKSCGVTDMGTCNSCGDPAWKTNDQELVDFIDSIPVHPQAQYSLNEQLKYLVFTGNRLGLYDAVDFLVDNIK